MKRLIVVMVLFAGMAFAQAPAAPQLKVSNDHRWLSTPTGVRFSISVTLRGIFLPS